MKIHVKDLYPDSLPVAIPAAPGAVEVIQVEEEDGTVSWYHTPVEGDELLKLAWVYASRQVIKDAGLEDSSLWGQNPHVLLKERLSEERLRACIKFGVEVFEAHDNGDGTYDLIPCTGRD